MENETSYLKFDAEGVKRHFQERDRKRWMQEGRKEVVERIEGILLNENIGVGRKLIRITDTIAEIKEWGIK